MYQRHDKSNEPDAEPNEIPNDCNMATELGPKEIENHHRAYRKVYQMESRDDHRDLTATDISAEEHHLEVERITGSLTVQSH